MKENNNTHLLERKGYKMIKRFHEFANKPVMFFLFILVAIITASFITFSITSSTLRNNYYSMTTRVVKVDESTDTVTVQDFNGNYWQFDGIEDWAVDGICSCIMDSKGTKEIKDDTIVSTKYDGWFEGWGKFF